MVSVAKQCRDDHRMNTPDKEPTPELPSGAAERIQAARYRAEEQTSAALDAFWKGPSFDRVAPNDLLADSGGCRSAFRSDVDQYSEVMSISLKTAVEDSLSAQVLCLQAVTATAVVTKLVKCEAVATSMDSCACGRPPRSAAVFRFKDPDGNTLSISEHPEYPSS